MTLTPAECARITLRLPAGRTHKLTPTVLRRRRITPSHPVGFVPRPCAWGLFLANVISLWSTGGRPHVEHGIVEFR